MISSALPMVDLTPAPDAGRMTPKSKGWNLSVLVVTGERAVSQNA
jgi:hypothetical protein